MKYIKPTDFLSVREFKAEYQRIERSITELLTEDASARTADELNKRLQTALNSAVKYLSGVNAKFVKTELPKAFTEGKESAAARAKEEATKITAEEAGRVLASQGYKYSKTAFSNDVYIELQKATLNAGKGLAKRINKLIDGLHKQGKDSLYNVQQAIKEDLQKNGVLTVKYANGAKQTLDTYAAMAARSARIETTNIGAIGRALQAGTDLVKMTRMPQCCKFCGAFQDKVYSISGKDKRFPALFKTVLRSGYALPHPNCRHEFIPYFAELEDLADVERMIKQSQIKYDSKGNLVDVRSQRDIQLYQSWQAGNRQRNAEYLEYERMKKEYAGREAEMPYKTLGAFRTARRRDELSPAFKAWRYRKQDTNTLECWSNVKNFRNFPKTLEKLQEIKYNDVEAWNVLKRERKTIEEINGKQWTETFYKKAIDTYYHFREKGIELTDHGVAKYLQRCVSEDHAIRNITNSFNYIQEDGKAIKYYEGLAVVYNYKKTEIVSFVFRKKPRSDWNEIKDE